MEKFDTRITTDQINETLRYLKTECLGETMKISRAGLAAIIFDAKLLTGIDGRMIVSAWDDRKVRDAIRRLQDRGEPISYAANNPKGGVFYEDIRNPSDSWVHYLNQRAARIASEVKTFKAQWYTYKRMYGSEKAAEIVRQYEFSFMQPDRFDSQGNETLQEPPIERLEEE
jgi:hypothetical protein